jgi:A/G-specific adenine glycosylase
LCTYCPLSEGCFAKATGRQSELPTPRVAKGARRSREIFMLVAMREDGSVLLERRPETGIWGGLWCLPEFETVSAARIYVGNTLESAQAQPKPLSTVEHAFTHFDLVITPLLTMCAGQAGVMDTIPTLWYNARVPARIGLPAPIKTLLENLSSPSLFDSRRPPRS